MGKIDDIRIYISRCHPMYQKDTFAQNVLCVLRALEIAEKALRDIAESKGRAALARRALAEIEAL